MTIATASIVNHRIDFVYLFDVKDGNPNGDPDMANTPRFDPETFQGLVSDVCLKRKIRDYVFTLKSQNGCVEEGYNVFVQSGHSLESHQRLPYDKLGLKAKSKDRETIQKAREWMCGSFYDVRAFGAVMSTTDFNCGQVRGPVQLTFSRSIDRVLATEHGITRVAYTKEQKYEETSGQTEMGNKHTVAYGLYRCHGFINPVLARQTGFSPADLEVLWKALVNMFDLDHSAARGLMTARHLFAFEHDSALGNAPSHKLFDRIQIQRRAGVEAPRSIADYEIAVMRDGLPGGITLTDKVNE